LSDKSGQLRLIPGLILISFVFVLGCLFLRAGEPWGGDFALYVMHAQNIAAGRPYAETLYLHNPAHAWISPIAYPPGLPLMLAPLVAVFGVDWQVLHLAMLAVFCLVLWLAFLRTRQSLGTGWGVFVALGTALTPLVAMHNVQVLSEFPFAAAMLGCVLLTDRSDMHPSWMRPLPLGLLVAAAMLTRAIGIVLPPALLLVLLLRRRPGWRAASAAVVAGALAALLVQRAFEATVGSYASSVAVPDLTTLVQDGLAALRPSLHWLFRFRREMGSFEAIAVDLLCCACLAGFVLRLRRFESLDVVLVAYLIAVLLFPIRLEMARYLIPVVPLLLLWAATPFALLAARLHGTARLLPGLAFIGLIAIAGSWFWATQRAMLTLSSTTAHEPLFAAIREKTPPDARVLASNPRIVALFSGRKASIWPEAPDEASLLAYARSIGASWIVEDRASSHLYAPAVRAALHGDPGRFRCVYDDPVFALWEILDEGTEK
jgi:Dolichyl-phosphate-mannose-protein mannosyltransferase